jgi:hypothetical protein
VALPGSGEEREVRAARNQSLFREINERLKETNDAFAEVVGTYAIACECADLECMETLEIGPVDYRAVRKSPRRFVVLRGHVYPDVERIVDEPDGSEYVVVEKERLAATVAESAANASAHDSA